MFPERFSNLPAYAFPRLRALLDVHDPAPAYADDIVNMTIGEPRHPFPESVAQVLAAEVAGFAKYPPNDGTPELRSAIADWVARRYGVTLDADRQIMALNGTREGLYNVTMALCPELKNGQHPVILMPNPFYQVYMIATMSVNAEPVFVPATQASGHLPDYLSLSPELLDRVAMAYICSPANPQGAVADEAYWAALIALAEKHDFKILADECYSEIYRDTPPAGALEVATKLGADPERVVIFHSLSKRSNLPGLRSGFVAGGPESIARIKQLRAYAGTPLPLPIQRVSEAVWADEAHVEDNRALYREKYALADEIFASYPGYQSPQAGFFLWLPVEDGEQAALWAWQEAAVRVLPGDYLSRSVSGESPGKSYIRVALVAPKEECARGLTRLRDVLQKYER
ncbi:aminotransferase class I/II-fold pyridoxal phosphate-dependent enzyme [Primorskyibacter sp. S187A]|uniref:aminotransferase class I/II-fold pyridoxal phosphate-dependent enzyme n=1 Tax=Primorskyibacter sp. S187A TaxID=3415130 RepID=UPI003C7ACDB4